MVNQRGRNGQKAAGNGVEVEEVEWGDSDPHLITNHETARKRPFSSTFRARATSRAPQWQTHGLYRRWYSQIDWSSTRIGNVRARVYVIWWRRYCQIWGEVYRRELNGQRGGSRIWKLRHNKYIIISRHYGWDRFHGHQASKWSEIWSNWRCYLLMGWQGSFRPSWPKYWSFTNAWGKS
jgi:hypothetical protein